MIKYAAIGGLIAVIGLSGTVALQRGKITRLKNDLAISKVQQASCSARTTNIIEDKESDAQVDDPEFTVPDRWMRGTTSAD